MEAPAGHARGVLIVDDEAALRKLVRRVLELDGYRVFDAADGDAALAQLRRHRPEIDLLFTDILMPGVNGVELARRAAQRWPDLPILYASGYDGGQLKAHGVDEASIDLLVKPFTPAELVDRVARALGRARGQAPPAEAPVPPA
jgi:DNA-binding response OmpR family regulator